MKAFIASVKEIFLNTITNSIWNKEKTLKIPLIIPELSEPPVRTLGATIPENESHIFR